MIFLHRISARNLRDTDFNESVVFKLCSNIKLNKSLRPDMIHQNVLKECEAELSYPLHTLFRKSLDDGSLPH